MIEFEDWLYNLTVPYPIPTEENSNITFYDLCRKLKPTNDKNDDAFASKCRAGEYEYCGLQDIRKT